MWGKLFVLSLCLVLSFATNGLDLDNDVCNSLGQADWNCLNAAHDFAIIQGVRGGNGMTANIYNCVTQATKAGFSHVDLYVWMCPNCEGNNPPSTLISKMVNTVGLKNFGMIWLDLETCDSDPTCWSDAQTNLDYITAMYHAANATGAKVGIYSTSGEWENLFGSLAPTSFNHLPLWYANPDNVQSFGDFIPFGGWNSPSIKQYDWYGNDCNVSYDADWYP